MTSASASVTDPRLPRVMHALAPGAAGGLESVVQSLAAGWADRGGWVGLSLTVDEGTEPSPSFLALRERGVEIVCHGMPPRAYIRERRAVMAAFERLAPEVVHTHGYRSDLLAGSAARRLGIPRVSTLHGFTGGDWKNRFYERLQLRALGRFDAVVAVAKPIVARLAQAGVPAERVALIPNGWSPLRPPLPRSEARAVLGLPPDAVVLGWVGRLSPEKGADLFLAALARLPRPTVLGAILGDGRQRSSLETQAEALGIAARIRWQGLVPDAGRLMAAFDGFVLSSRTEGTPIALLEAMAAGTPVVATAVGGVPFVVEADTEALLVPPDDPAALATALGATLDDRGASTRRAAAARTRLDADFAPGPWIDRHRALYQSILARRRGEKA